MTDEQTDNQPQIDTDGGTYIAGNAATDGGDLVGRDKTVGGDVQRLAILRCRDAALFWGREKLTAELVAYLNQQRFQAMIGASGRGKSSLVRAGLAAAFQTIVEHMAHQSCPAFNRILAMLWFCLTCWSSGMVFNPRMMALFGFLAPSLAYN